MEQGCELGAQSSFHGHWGEVKLNWCPPREQGGLGEGFHLRNAPKILWLINYVVGVAIS